MMRMFLHFCFLTILLALQVSFVHALPYPFDRIPLVLVVTVYLYQYANQTASWWWLISYGMVLDVLMISFAPLEAFSYSIATATMVLLVSHVFTNRSFYGISATAILTLSVLTLSELTFIGLTQLFSDQRFIWKDVILSQVWAMVFASFLLLFIFPFFRKMHVFASKTLLKRI